MPLLESHCGGSEATLAEHLIPLLGDPSEEWALWRCACLRGAGFPASDISCLAVPELVAAVDHLTTCRDEVRERSREAREAALLEREKVSRDRLNQLNRAIQKLRKNRVPPTLGLSDATAAAVDRLRSALESEAAARAEYLRAFEAADGQVASAIQRLAAGNRFREALIWQNRDAAKRIGNVRQAGGSSRSRWARRDELTIASYLERYCTKNDTIGFFGPVGWAELGEGDITISVRPGPDFVERRKVFFEGWCIDALADSLAALPAARPWLAPLRTPLFRIEGRVLRTPAGETLPLPPVVLALFAAANGERSARDLVREVLANPALGIASEPAVYQMLHGMHARGFIAWRFPIPLELEPERSLRNQIGQIEDEEFRALALAALDELEGARDAVARAAGDVEALDRALGELADRFTERTHLAATRASGETYAGRTLVYEDCRRDVRVDLGGRFVAELGPPVSLLLQSARWFTYRLAEHHRDVLSQLFGELTHGTGSQTIDLLAFYRHAIPSLWSPETKERLPRELQRRWEEVLAIPSGPRQVRYSSSELRPRVLQAFAAPHAGWSKARHHSPDLMIAASSPEAIERGDYEIVLGELHPAVNTLNQGLFMAQHPSPEKVLASLERDLPEPAVVPQVPKHWRPITVAEGFEMPGFLARGNVALVASKDFFLQLVPEPLPAPSSRVLPVSDLIVTRRAGCLYVEPRDGRCRFDLVEFFQIILTVLTVDTFEILTPRRYLPRITVDRLVLVRETWRLPANELEFAWAPTSADRFAEARCWGRGLGLPRFIFAKTPQERKPFYVDLHSPVSVEILARAVRLSAEQGPSGSLVTLREMYPGPGQLWLPDAQGNRYTSELRVVAVDCA